MRWLQTRGAAIRALNLWTPDYSDICARKKWRHLRDASMMLLPQLPNLQTLCVAGGHEFMVPERHLHAIELLPNLQHLDLSLTSDGTWSESTLEPLKHMTALITLNLSICQMRGPLLVSPFLAQLTQLRELRLDCGPRGFDSEINQAHLMQTVSKLRGLRTLALDGMVESVPAGLERLAYLKTLELRRLDLEDSSFAIPSSFRLCTKLRHICLSLLDNASDEMWQLLCSVMLLLPDLLALNLSNMDLSEVHPSSWALSSSLTSLDLNECSISMLPAAVSCLPQS